MLARQRRRCKRWQHEQLPYNVCVIALEEQAGLPIASNVLHVAPEDIIIDMPVAVTFMPSPDEPAVMLAMFVPVYMPALLLGNQSGPG